MLSLPSIIKNPLAELANLRKIHENSKVSNKQFQPDVEEQRKLIINQITKKVVLFSIKKEKIKYLHDVKLKNINSLDHDDIDNNGYNDNESRFMNDFSNDNKNDHHRYFNKLRPYTTSTLPALNKGKHQSNKQQYVSTRRPFTSSLIETVYNEDFHDELFDEINILHKDNKAFFDGLFRNSTSSIIIGRSNFSGGDGDSISSSVNGSVTGGSVDGNSNSSSSIRSTDIKAQGVGASSSSSNSGGSEMMRNCVACQFTAKRNYEVIDINCLITKPVIIGK